MVLQLQLLLLLLACWRLKPLWLLITCYMASPIQQRLNMSTLPMGTILRRLLNQLTGWLTVMLLWQDPLQMLAMSHMRLLVSVTQILPLILVKRSPSDRLLWVLSKSRFGMQKTAFRITLRLKLRLMAFGKLFWIRMDMIGLPARSSCLRLMVKKSQQLVWNSICIPETALPLLSIWRKSRLWQLLEQLQMALWLFWISRRLLFFPPTWI